jgi:two-component system response regulator MprA
VAATSHPHRKRSRIRGRHPRRTGKGMATRLLLVDDDPKIVSLLQRGLAFEGFDVLAAAGGVAALETARLQRPHVVLLDISMPGPDGFEVCRQMRLLNNAPIIMLTARDETSDKVRALNLGADDYVAKPFDFDELIARIRAVLRRQHGGDETVEYDDLVVEPGTREARRHDQPIDLTAREYDLLLFFARHSRQVLTREQILEHVWGYATPVETNVVEVHVGHLRQKLESGGGRRLIQTYRGIGYALR